MLECCCRGIHVSVRRDGDGEDALLDSELQRPFAALLQRPHSSPSTRAPPLPLDLHAVPPASEPQSSSFLEELGGLASEHAEQRSRWGAARGERTAVVPPPLPALGGEAPPPRPGSGAWRGRRASAPRPQPQPLEHDPCLAPQRITGPAGSALSPASGPATATSSKFTSQRICAVRRHDIHWQSSVHHGMICSITCTVLKRAG